MSIGPGVSGGEMRKSDSYPISPSFSHVRLLVDPACGLEGKDRDRPFYFLRHYWINNPTRKGVRRQKKTKQQQFNAKQHIR